VLVRALDPGQAPGIPGHPDLMRHRQATA